MCIRDSPCVKMPCFLATARLFLPSPIVARKVPGLNSPFFLDAALGPMILNCNPKVRYWWIHAANSDARSIKTSKRGLARTHWGAVIPCLGKELHLRSRQAPISMGFGARLPGTQLAFFSRLSATSGAPHRQCLFLGDFHGSMMRVYSVARWSVLTSVFGREPVTQERNHDSFPPTESDVLSYGVPRENIRPLLLAYSLSGKAGFQTKLERGELLWANRLPNH